MSSSSGNNGSTLKVAGGVVPRQKPPVNSLVRSGIGVYIGDMLHTLLRYRPENPIEYMSDYLENVVKGVPAVKRAFRQLRLTSYRHPRFPDSVAAAFDILATGNNNNGNGKILGAAGGGSSSSSFFYSSPSPSSSSSSSFARKKNNCGNNSARSGGGVPGQDFMQLLGMVCSDYSPQASDLLLRRFKRSDGDSVSFAGFEAAVVCCLMYEDFITSAEQLFTALDAHGQTGCLRKELCQTLISQLVLSPSQRDGSALVEVQAAMQRLLSGVEPSPPPGHGIMLADFLRSASSVFLRIVLSRR